MTDTPRPHALECPWKLADLPLDPAFAPRVLRSSARIPGAPAGLASVETYACVTPEGASTPRPSLVLAAPPEIEPGEELDRDGSVAEGRVAFEWDGLTLRCQLALPVGTALFGLGERAGPLERSGRQHLLWNTDSWRYSDRTEALYQSHPWVLALLPDGSCTGILFDSPSRGLITCAVDGLEGAFEGGPYDVHVLRATRAQDVVSALSAMTGRIERPPLWALGYHQCRYSYMDAAEVRALAQRMRDARVPCDAVWFDIDYMDRYRVFTWNRESFPDPAGLIAELRAAGFRSVAILDPGIAIGEDSSVHAAGLQGDHFVRGADQEPVAGRVWPGLCHFPDFTQESTRTWWAGLVTRLVETSGLDGLWNDMNEPVLFRTPNRTLPDDAQHRGEPSGSHARLHNLYGQLMAQATREGVLAARPEERPFVLTRANHLSGARFSATWTGDNMARWEDLQWAIPMVLNLGLSGQPFSGPDLGGFSEDPTGELFVRWFELGAYLPFCRGHAEKGTCRKEPWSFGEDALDAVRGALERRMRLLPTLVTLFEQAHRDGLPVCRPLFFADPLDPRLRTADDAFLLGEDLLVAPVVQPGARTKDVALPPGVWHSFPGGEQTFEGAARLDAPLGTTPVLARAGSILFEAGLRQHTEEPDDLRTWHVFLDGEGAASGSVYHDGSGLGDPGTWVHVRATASVAGVRLEVSAEPSGVPQTRHVIVHGASALGYAEDGVRHADESQGAVTIPW